MLGAKASGSGGEQKCPPAHKRCRTALGGRKKKKNHLPIPELAGVRLIHTWYMDSSGGLYIMLSTEDIHTYYYY